MGIPSSIQDWASTNKAYQSIIQDYKTELQSILAAMRSTGANHMSPGLALWLFQTRCMPDATNSCETEMKLQAVSLNIANALRNDITNAQNDYNTMIQDIEKGDAAGGQAAGNKMWEDLEKIRKDLAYPGMTKILGASNLKNLIGYVSSIEGNPINFQTQWVPYTKSWVSNGGGNRNPEKHGGHWSYKWTYMRFPIPPLYNQYASAYCAAVKSGQPPDQVFSLTTSSFNNLNQSVSGISSSIQAQMQYLNQNLQQYFGIYKSFFDSYSQLSSYIVNKTNNS